MAVTRTVVRNLSLAGLEPEEVIEQANAMLVADTSDAMFVTLFLAQYDPATGEAVYVNAGHPRPYVVGPAGKPRPFGDVTAPLLGITDDYEMGPFASARERLNVGETLVVFTDGVTEARAPDGRMLTDTGLETLIAAYSETPVDELCRHLADELDDYQHRHRADDVTLLALKRNR
jgi:sigma-B regulation protein RsbU (phosphoserine phosphatase)